MFGDFSDNEDAMVSCMTSAGISETDAKDLARRMYSVTSSPSFVEVYGKSISDHVLHARRNLNVRGLGSLDLRSTKADGQHWDFTKKSDRREAKHMIDTQNPDWVIGAPPCTPFPIWNYA